MRMPGRILITSRIIMASKCRVLLKAAFRGVMGESWISQAFEDFFAHGFTHTHWGPKASSILEEHFEELSGSSSFCFSEDNRLTAQIRNHVRRWRCPTIGSIEGLWMIGADTTKQPQIVSSYGRLRRREGRGELGVYFCRK